MAFLLWDNISDNIDFVIIVLGIYNIGKNRG